MKTLLRVSVSTSLGLSMAACGSDPIPESGPDPSRVFEARARVDARRDDPFLFETVTRFRTTDRLPDLDVRSLLVTGDRVYAGTPTGLFSALVSAEAFAPVPGVASALDLALATDGSLLAIGPGALYRIPANGSVSTITSSSGLPFLAVTDAGGRTFVATMASVREVSSSTVTRVSGVTGVEIRDLLGTASELIIATDQGVARMALSSGELSWLTAPAQLLDDDARVLALVNGELLVGSAAGLTRLSNPPVFTRGQKGGLPIGDLTAVSATSELILTGHTIGASAISRNGKLDHYHTERWIAAELVTSVAIGPESTRWIGTSSGLTKISLEPTTLAEKAAVFEAQLDKHWRMDGFMDEEIGYPDPYDLDATPRTDDHDNDGLWTEMQIAPWCFAYAMTNDERYYQKARKAMDVMMMQIDIPGLSFEAAGKKRGFITRSLVRDDEGAVFEGKATQSNWHLQSFEGRDYYWKDDTSSDEYAGHFFGIPVFYDLCAQSDEERREISDRMRLVMDYIIDGGYQLIDLDGERTTHGVWNDLAIAVDTVDGCPEKHSLVDCVFSWAGGGWLNSLEILGHLLATWHITKDPKYYAEYDRLFTSERYGGMIPVKESTSTVTDPGIANHSDHELAMLSYFTLLRYEPNSDRRERIIESVRTLLRYEAPERNPWQIATVASAFSGELPLEDAVASLREISLDLRNWRYDNSHRKDASLIVRDRHGGPQFDTAFPYDEIKSMKWNSSPYSVEGGGSGASVQYSTPWLLAYWMLKYYGGLTD
ncbi:MAG: hypothetical protein HYV07_05420 [Deltaproteobacteria bacterium]|nr:hypothetical protein [Deltaproteobacteria bacterium]